FRDVMQFLQRDRTTTWLDGLLMGSMIAVLGPGRRGGSLAVAATGTFMGGLQNTGATADGDFSFVLFCRFRQNLLQHAVHDQIRIATDGRGEVRVGGGGQRKVAKVLL